MKPATTAYPALLAALALSQLALPAASQAGGAIDINEPGVVCDAGDQLCYNQTGLSVESTRRTFGRSGAEKARELIRRGERGRTFKLSNGVACDVNARTCWDDGWKRRNISGKLTRHLFGSGSQGSWSSTSSPSWNDGWGGGTSGYTADCLLRRGGRTLFQGSCELQEQNNGRERRFIATMRNGPRYVFQNRGGDVSISDGTGGSWPVQYRDYGRAAVFRWADMSLETRQGQGADGGSSNNRNRTLEEVLRQLFN
jgi:hypothetical protein